MSNPETANFTNPAQFFQFFNISEDKVAELTAHLQYQTTKKALESKLITTRIYNCLLSGYSEYDDVKDETRKWWANSAYNLGFAKKDEFIKIRNMGIKNVGELNNWINDYHILTLDDYLECENAGSLISKLEEGQKILNEKRPNWRRAMGLSTDNNVKGLTSVDAIQESSSTIDVDTKVASDRSNDVAAFDINKERYIIQLAQIEFSDKKTQEILMTPVDDVRLGRTNSLGQLKDNGYTIVAEVVYNNGQHLIDRGVAPEVVPDIVEDITRLGFRDIGFRQRAEESYERMIANQDKLQQVQHEYAIKFGFSV